MRTSRTFRSLLASVAVLAFGALALAQDYTCTAVTGKWVAPPTTATDITVGSTTYTTLSNLPFPIPYYGKTYTSMFVSAAGNVQFNTTGYWYPYAPSGPLTGSYEGFCGVAWAYLSNTSASSRIRWWVDGAAPDRRLIVAWTNVHTVWTANSTINAQVQFNESTGRVTMAYTGSWNEQNSGSPQGYVVCLDEPGGNRFVRPPSGESSGQYYFPTTPPNDWQFDPRITTYTGTVRYDRLVADGTGVGNSPPQAGVPLSGLRVDLRDSTGATVAFGTCDANGSYTVRGLALVGSQVGSLAVVSRSLASVVRPPYTSPSPATAPYAFPIATNIAFSSSANVGTYTIGAAVDPGGTNRAPLHIARSIQEAYDKIKQFTADEIPELEVTYSNAAIEPTNYNKGGTPATASMRVSGPANSNPDPWDTGVLHRTYAHHVLNCIAGAQSTGFDTSFDAITDDQNAFAEGFGYYLAALLSGSSNFYDTVNSNTATTINLESPQPSTRRGSDVTAWVAAALYDLLDGANESWDDVDGAGAAGERPIQVVNALTSAPTASSFYLKWGETGLPGTAGLARNFIFHGAVGDDASESNDSAAEATAFAAPGFRRSQMVLNPYNEDWFEFQLSQAATGLAADVSADFQGSGTTATLELRNAAGALLATGVLQPGNVLLRAVIPGSSAPGVYRVRVRHDTGGRLGAYVVQAYTPLAMTSAAFTPWTVKRPYNVTLTAVGGVPPYRVTIEQPFVQPPGLLLDSANLRVTGSPQQVGTQNFVLSVRDDAEPPNVASVPQSFVVNDELYIGLGEFLAFPLGRAVDQIAPFSGGTAPHQFTLTAGTAPSGLQLDVATLRFHGTPDQAGSSYLSLSGVDLAGSTDSAQTMAVVAVPLTGASVPVELATGDSACGFYFDAVSGSSVSVSAKTAKKRAKRPLRVVVLDPKGKEMTGLAIKSGIGSASVSKIPCAVSGRYFVVIASGSGDATQLLGALKVAVPKKGSGVETDFGQGDTMDVVMGALPGAQVTVTTKPDKSGLKLRGFILRDPTGAVVPFQPGELTDVGNGFVFAKTLATGGTWILTVQGKPGPSGSFSWALKIVQPKGAIYSAD